MNNPTAIIIGSGVAGMATAARLASQGYRVSVYEKNSYPGGKLSVFEQDGYRFDAGPSLFTQPQNLEELFSETGEDLKEFMQYKPVEIACQYFYENGKVLRAFTNREEFARELHEVTGEDPGALQRYLDDSGRLYEDVGQIFVNHSLHKRATWFNKRVIRALKTVQSGHLFSSLNQLNERYFSTPEARQLFNRYATYNGSNPYKAPGMLSLIPHLEQNLGTFYPIGGMISISNALHKLAEKKGARFYFNSPVERIIHHEGKIRGVVVNGENVTADLVVSNNDVYFTYKHLLNHSLKAGKVLKHERSSSALIFYWGIKQSLPSLHLHNIFFSNNYPQEFDHIFNKGELYTDPTVYINITSKMEKGHAPEGCENWFVMVNAPANTGQNWEELRSRARSQVIDKINRMLGIDIESLIETEQWLDPVLIEERTSSFRGSLYGTSSNDRMAAFARHANFTSYIKGLYFCGGSVHPGGGIPLCLKSARIVGNLIKNQSHGHTH